MQVISELPRRIRTIATEWIVLSDSTRLAATIWYATPFPSLLQTPLAAAVFFGAIFVASATVAFRWIESGELANSLTYGGRDFTS